MLSDRDSVSNWSVRQSPPAGSAGRVKLPAHVVRSRRRAEAPSAGPGPVGRLPVSTGSRLRSLKSAARSEWQSVQGNFVTNLKWQCVSAAVSESMTRRRPGGPGLQVELSGCVINLKLVLGSSRRL